MKNKVANSAPLGSLGFGMTTILYSIVNTGVFEVNSMLLSMAIFLGGLAQLLAGYLEYKKGNTFGFISYFMFGLYWLTLVSLTLLPINNLSPAPEKDFMGWFFFLWSVFCLILLDKALKLDKLTKIIFTTVVVLFSAITIATFTDLLLIEKFSGYWGILVGGLAMYSAYKNFD